MPKVSEFENGRFTQLRLCKLGKQKRRLSASQSQALWTSRRAQVAGEEKKETARNLSARNTIPCFGQVLNLFRTEASQIALFRTARPKNHTLSSGTYPNNPNRGVPPPGCRLCISIFSCKVCTRRLCRDARKVVSDIGGSIRSWDFNHVTNNNPQVLYSLWRRANAQNVYFTNLPRQ